MLDNIFLDKADYSVLLLKVADIDRLEVKAHDLRALFASKAFYGAGGGGRVLTDQIMQACHWKSQNTFTSYLKDLSG